MTKETAFKVGQYVRLVAPSNVDAVVGRIIAIEVFEDFNGCRRWIYVGWYLPNGMRSEPEKHSEQELIHEDEV